MDDLSRRSFVAAAGAFWLASVIPMARAQGKIKPGPDTALVVVDVQNCFLPGGSLAVEKGDEIVPLINTIARLFRNVVLTQDWHTPGHISFASSHDGKKPFESIKVALRQPDPVARPLRAGHRGRRHQQGLDIPHAQLVIRKGYNPKVDSYSAFIEADGKLKTGLDGYSQGARHQDDLRHRPRHRLLRRLDRDSTRASSASRLT